MARVSFQLRRPLVGYGSLRYDPSLPPGALTDYDSALRADGFLLAPLEVTESSFSTSSSQCYGEVNLSWEVKLTAVEDLGAYPEPTHTVLVYSPFGEPETVTSGDILSESADRFVFDHTGLPEGKWAYYGLFLRYLSTGGQDDYYEKVASLSELVTKNYGSTLMLWERIPPFYRNEDAKIGDLNYDERCLGFPTYGDPVGPLLKFLSIIGFEIDKTRTLIDHQMVSRDPQLANSTILDVLSVELATVFRQHDLGTSRLRLLMDNIGAFRRAKGTVTGTSFFLEALTGSNISINQTTRQITLYSQRANLMPDPQNTKYGEAGSYIDWRPADYDEIYPEDVTFDDRDPQDTNSINEIERVSGHWKFINAHNDRTDEVDYTVYPPAPPIANAQDLLVGAVFQILLPITAVAGDVISFSVHSGIGSHNIVWARLVDNTTGAVRSASDRGVNRGAKYFDLLVPFNGTFKVEYLIDLRPGPFRDFQFLIEKNYAGPYFDGSTVRGGWLTGANSVSDHRWSGVPHDSPSLYHEDYERTKQALDAYLEEVLPIDVASSYTIVDYKAIA